MAIKTYYLLKRFTDTSEKNLPFYIENLTSNSSNILMNASNTDATNVEYSTDNSTWTAVTLGNNQYTIPVAAYGKTYIRANATHWGINVNSKVVSFQQNFNAGGNIMSLLYGSIFTGTEVTFPDNTATDIFRNMFYNVGNLQSAEKLALPATTLTSNCYQNMFYGCPNLTAAPILPAATLASNCYNGMFQGCTALTAAPELPATTLIIYCYSRMFQGCTSLTTAPALPATTLASGCYNQMFSGCTSLTAAPAILPATTLANDCYNQMFSGCTSLTAAPALPATTLTDRCYYGMFGGCTNLNSVTVGATSWNTNYTNNWLYNVSATGTFTKPSATNIPEGTNGIPSGWTVVNV